MTVLHTINQERFSRVVISNTGLPYNPDVPDEVLKQVEGFRAKAKTPTLPEMSKALSKISEEGAPMFAYWQKFCWETENMPIGMMMQMSMEKPSQFVMATNFLLFNIGIGKLSPFRSELAKAYDAPFPDSSYKMGLRAMPSQVPTLPNDPSLDAQRKAWEFFSSFAKPFLCAFADNDPVTKGGDAVFLERVPGTKGQAHTTIKGGGHFVQENCPEQVTKIIVDLIRST